MRVCFGAIDYEISCLYCIGIYEVIVRRAVLTVMMCFVVKYTAPSVPTDVASSS